MDIIRYLNIFAVISPFVYAVFLFVFKISIINVNKKILNNGLILINLFSLIIFLYTLYKVYSGNIEISLSLPFIKFDKFIFNFDFIINKLNVVFLFYGSLIAFIFSIYLKFYFKKFKQYIFTKQGFLNLFSFSIFILYLFILSSNLLNSCIFWTILSSCILLLGIFDLFKNNTNSNVARYSKISLLGDCALLFAVVLLLKYNFIQSGLFENLKYENLNLIINFMRKSNSIFDLKIIIIFLNLALFTRFYIIPFASYSAFLSSSSNLVYLTAVCFINSISGVYLFKNTIYLFKNLLHFDLAVFILCALTIAASLIIILFEKNIKIIFGYTYAVINSLFLSSYIYFKNSNIIIYIYFVINLLVFSILAFAFFENKYEFSKRLITKQKGFILEKIYILLFEKFPLFISNVINFLDKKIVQNAMRVLILFIDLIITKIFLKSQRPKTQSKAKQILIFFAIIAVFAIFIALFGGADVK